MLSTLEIAFLKVQDGWNTHVVIIPEKILMLEMIAISSPEKAQRVRNRVQQVLLSALMQTQLLFFVHTQHLPSRIQSYKKLTTEMDYFALHDNTVSTRWSH